MATVLLLHFDGADGSTTITDATDRHSPTALGTSTIDTSTSAFGNASLRATSAGDGVSVPNDNDDFRFGTGDFTIDFRFRIELNQNHIYLDFRPSTPSNAIVLSSVVDVHHVRLLVNGVEVLQGTTSVLDGGWHHGALTRKDGTTRLFVGGVQEGGDLADTTDYIVGSNIFIAGSFNGLTPNNGWMDEVRIIKGFAAWTSDFTPPAGPYTLDTNEPRAPLYIKTWGYEHHIQLRTWIGIAPPTVTVAPFNQEDWQRPIPWQHPVQLRSWTWNYNLNLIAQDQLPVGGIRTELTVKPYEFHSQLRQWSWKYNPLLIGKDRLPVGEIRTELTTKPYEHHIQLRQWEQWYNLNLIGQDALPVGTIENVVPRGYEHHVQLRSWTWQYNQNLIAQDVLPTGVELYELPPQPPLSAIQLRTWISSANLALSTPPLARPFSQYDWPLNTGPLQPTLIWTASYNQNLIAQDKLPFHQDYWPLTPAAIREANLSTWINDVKLALTTRPFRQTDWPVPVGPKQPALSWTASYNLNLIGQDLFPSGEVVTDLPPQPPLSSIQLRTWISFVSLALFTPPQPKPFAQLDWPLNFGPLQPIKTFFASYNLNLIGQDQLPVGLIIDELPPRAPQQPIPIYTVTFNKNLIGQDFLPIGERVTELTPPLPLSSIQLRTWISFSSLALVTPPAPRPFAQYDWPLNFGPLQPIKTFTASYNLDLIGQDQLPTGEIVVDLPPRGPQQPIPIFTASYNKNLIGQDLLPVGRDVFELPPQPALSAIQLRTWIQTVNLALTTQAAAFPFNQYDWPNPILSRPQARTFTTSYTLELIGQDRLPFRQQDWPLPTQPPRPLSLTAWFDRAKSYLQRPHRQLDWPIPRAHQQPIQTFIGFYNRNLIGKDRLPVGDIVTDRTPPGYIYPSDLRVFTKSINLGLFFPPAPLPFNQDDWSIPAAWAMASLGYRDRSFVSGTTALSLVPFNPIPPPPEPTPPEDNPYRFTPGLEWQIYDRIREPGNVGWR